MAKVINSSSPYKLPNDLYRVLFKAPKVEEEMVKTAGSTCPLGACPLPFSFDLQSSMATWCLGWHAILLSKYLHSKCGHYEALEAVLYMLHSAIQESHQTSARGASVAIAASCHLVVGVSALWDCRDLWSSFFFYPLHQILSLCRTIYVLSRSSDA